MENKIRTALTNALEAAPKRGFTESVDLSFTIKDVDLKNPSNRIQEEIRLPKGRGKDVTIAMFVPVKYQQGIRWWNQRDRSCDDRGSRW